MSDVTHRKDRAHLKPKDEQTQEIIDALAARVPSSIFDWKPMHFVTAALVGIALGCLALPLGMHLEHKRIYENEPFTIDGFPLDEEEMESIPGMVRAIRKAREYMKSRRSKDRVARRTAELMEEAEAKKRAHELIAERELVAQRDSESNKVAPPLPEGSKNQDDPREEEEE